MNHKTQAIFTLTLLLLVIMFIHLRSTHEQFASKSAKANAIYDWFLNRSDHKYTDYKRNVEKSNVVEFEDALRLYQQRDFTKGSIIKML